MTKAQQNHTTALAVRRPVEVPAPVTAFTPGQIELMKQTIMPGASTEELQVFVGTALHSQLDPFAVPKQIHAIRAWDDKLKTYRWIPCPAIDGLRLIASRTGDYEGQTPVEWCDASGHWVDVWLAAEPPAAARVGVYRRGFREPVYGLAKWKSFVRSYKDKQGESRIMPIWQTMPDHMLAKVAEAIALKRAFPNDLAQFRMITVEGQPLEVDVDEGPLRPDVAPVRPPPSRDQVRKAYEDVWGEAPPETALPVETPAPPLGPEELTAKVRELTPRDYYVQLAGALETLGHPELVPQVPAKAGERDYQRAIGVMRPLVARYEAEQIEGTVTSSSAPVAADDIPF